MTTIGSQNFDFYIFKQLKLFFASGYEIKYAYCGSKKIKTYITTLKIFSKTLLGSLVFEISSVSWSLGVSADQRVKKQSSFPVNNIISLILWRV